MGLEREDILTGALVTIAAAATVLVLLVCGYACYNTCEMPDLRDCCPWLVHRPRAVNIYNPAAQLPPTLPAPTHSAFVQQNPIRSFP